MQTSNAQRRDAHMGCVRLDSLTDLQRHFRHLQRDLAVCWNVDRSATHDTKSLNSSCWVTFVTDVVNSRRRVVVDG